MRKEDKLLGLREEILTEKSEQTPIEQFQNTTIRPILKYQHTILIVFFNSNIHVQYIVSANSSLLKKQNQLNLVWCAGSKLRVGAATPTNHQGCRHYSHCLLPLDLLAPFGLPVSQQKLRHKNMLHRKV